MGNKQGFSEHKVLLCLDKDLYRAFVKLQAEKDLGRSYAGLLPYVEGLYQLGYISREVYENHCRRYSEPYGKTDDRVSVKAEGQKLKNILDQKEQQFKGMIAQFELHSNSEEWLLKCGREAEKFKDQFDSAADLLRLIENVKKHKTTVQ